MNEPDFTILFSSLTPAKQAHALTSLAHHLTVCARATDPGELGQQQAVVRLLSLNEIQQAVTAQLAPLMADDDRRYPDDVFIKVLFETARNGNTEGDLEWALNLAARGSNGLISH